MATTDRLTDKFIRSTTSDAKQETVWDESRPGFFLRVQRTGVRSFGYCYREPGDRPARARRQRWLMLGRYNPDDPEPSRAFTLADAIRGWRAASGQVAQGKDPQGPSPRLQREGGPGVVPLLAEVPKELHAKVREIFGTSNLLAESFGELARDFLVLHAWVVKRRVRDDEQMLVRDLLPQWRDRPAAEIRREDVVRLTEAIVRLRGARVAANHVRLLVSRIFNFAISRGRSEHNPAHLVRIVGGKAKPRDRWLSDLEIQKLWFGLEECGTVFAALIRTRLVLLQRPGEVAAMEWQELQPDGWWVMPGRKIVSRDGRQIEVGTKNKLTHAVFVPPLAAAQIQGLRDLTGSGRFVFESPKTPGQPLWSTNKVLTALVRRLGIAHLSPHDLRRTGTTNLQRLGYDNLVDPLVNHQPQGVRASYNLWSFREERQAAMLEWDRYLRGVLGL